MALSKALPIKHVTDRKRAGLLAGLTGFLVLTVGIGAWRLFRQETAVDRATTLLALAQKGDGHDLFPLLSEAERGSGITSQVVEKVLTGYILPSFPGKDGEIKPLPTGDVPASGLVNRMLTFPNGRDGWLATAADSDTGVETQGQFFAGLVYSAFIARHRHENDPNTKPALVRGVREDGVLLEKMGLPGLKYGGAYYKWPDLEAHLIDLMQSHHVAFTD